MTRTPGDEFQAGRKYRCGGGVRDAAFCPSFCQADKPSAAGQESFVRRDDQRTISLTRDECLSPEKLAVRRTVGLWIRRHRRVFRTMDLHHLHLAGPLDEHIERARFLIEQI